MAWKSTFLLTSLLVGSYATPLALPHHARSEKIAWGNCEDEGVTAPAQCGNLTVPLDYTEPDSGKTIQLQLLKVPAIREPKKGTILFNFGGPGLEARLSLFGQGDILQALTGGHYDLIAHDPRGTANTLTAYCSRNVTEQVAARTESRFNDFPLPSDTMGIGRQWAGSGLYAEFCSEGELQENGAYLGTAFTARDLMQIVDAVTDDGLLKYWGFSYGTALGSTVAAMFPDRVDKMILDGVMNPHQYFNSYDTELWAATDEVFSSFFQQCLKTPEQCALASRNQTAEQLEESIYQLLDDLKREPIVYEQSIIDHSYMKTFIRFALYTPSSYPSMASAFNFLLDDNVMNFTQLVDAQVGGLLAAGMAGNDAAFAIPCADKETGKHTLDEIMPDLNTLSQTSRLLGEVGNAIAMTCTQWKFDAKERYEGNFESKTKNPIMVIGNTYDSATPLQSAQNISASFEGSVLLEHGGWGHATLAQGSSCTSRIIRDYWTNGTLPAVGTKCEPDYPPFAPGSLKDVLVNIGFLDEE
ncbi:Alpha/Beta hydrolase protein [Aspergillus parasiticus]|uniref:Alpha/Beta hydrolase protein n=2 Tax=Aspergillus subgen. Circumdati TaxID=2720871 RepID=A0A5N6E230_ASPPA|nr:Alpha/Beta hydrolase protein [Aspergillus parasiticus]KAE8311889.1 Alpha/Beta hydrolase protein [Aspergillus transmontanensis]